MRFNRDAKCFFPVESKDLWNPLRMNTERCRREAGHNSYPLECRLSAGRLFRQKPRKYCQLETQSSWWCRLQSICFLNQSAPSQNMFLHALIPNICIYGYRFWKWRRFGWYWWVFLSISGEVWLYKEWKNQKNNREEKTERKQKGFRNLKKERKQKGLRLKSETLINPQNYNFNQF